MNFRPSKFAMEMWRAALENIQAGSLGWFVWRLSTPCVVSVRKKKEKFPLWMVKTWLEV